MDYIDIWRAAEQVRKLYRADAVVHSAMRADKLMDQGDAEGFEMWKRAKIDRSDCASDLGSGGSVRN